MYHVSILGLGLIGSRIARHMAGMGDTVTVWNRTPREDFPEAVPTPADAARASKIIQLYLKDRNACLEVFEQMREALTPEHIILNHSTIDLATVGKLSLMSSSIGCTYVDCPFTGSRLPAEKGELVYYVGTDSTTLDRIRPVLEHSSRDILHLGGIGAGTVVKLVTNMVSATMVQSLSEALAISQAYGISPEMLGQAHFPERHCLPSGRIEAAPDGKARLFHSFLPGQHEERQYLRSGTCRRKRNPPSCCRPGFLHHG